MIGVAVEFPQFRKIWISQVISQLGDWLGRLAILELIRRLGGSEAAVGVGFLYGIELALRLTPSAVLSPLAGSLADRVPRRLVMIVTDVLRALIVLGFLLLREPSHLPWLYVLLVAQMGTGIFFETARTAAVPSTLPPDRLVDAHALSAATWSINLTAGALLGGVLVATAGVGATLAIDAATYLLSALVLRGVDLPPVEKPAERWSLRDALLFGDLRRGLRHARALHILPAVLTKCFWGAAGGYLVLLPIAAAERFARDGAASGAVAAGSAAGFYTGLLYTARGLGTWIGPVLAKRFIGRDDRALRLQISLGFLCGSLGYVLFTLTRSVPLALGCVFLAHLGGSTIWVASSVLWQQRVANAFRGRVASMEWLAMQGAFASGGLLAGVVYDSGASLDQTFLLLAGLVFVGGCAWSLVSRRVGSTPAQHPHVTEAPPVSDSLPEPPHSPERRPAPGSTSHNRETATPADCRRES